jgi:hypothetical protein
MVKLNFYNGQVTMSFAYYFLHMWPMPKTRNYEHNEYKQLAKWWKNSFPLQPFDMIYFFIKST